MLTTAALNLGLLTAFFFVLGMIKPQWPLFFMDKPNRLIILVVSTLLTMVSFTMFGEGHRRNSMPNQWTKVPVADVSSPVTPVTVPVPVPVVSPVPVVKSTTAEPAVAPVQAETPKK